MWARAISSIFREREFLHTNFRWQFNHCHMMCVSVCVRERLWVYERECVCEWVSEWVREWVWERMWVYVWEKESVCMCVEERVCMWKREWERVKTTSKLKTYLNGMTKPKIVHTPWTAFTQNIVRYFLWASKNQSESNLL